MVKQKPKTKKNKHDDEETDRKRVVFIWIIDQMQIKYLIKLIFTSNFT